MNDFLYNLAVDMWIVGMGSALAGIYLAVKENYKDKKEQRELVELESEIDIILSECEMPEPVSKEQYTEIKDVTGLLESPSPEEKYEPAEDYIKFGEPNTFDKEKEHDNGENQTLDIW